ALVVRERPRMLSRARDPGSRPDVAMHHDAIALVAVGPPDGRPKALGRPRRLQAPLAAHLGDVRRRAGRPAYEHREGRLTVDTVRLVSKPAGEPADELGHEVDVRAGNRRRRGVV